MDAFVVTKANRLGGKIKLKGAKNSILPIIAACVLTSDEILISNCPNLSDIRNMLDIIRSMGGFAQQNGSEISIRCESIDPNKINKSLMSKIRSSIFILGPLLARCGEAKLSMPGGCEIGKRPIDLHLGGLKQLGVHIRETESEIGGELFCKGTPHGGMVRLKYPSVGATENLMMAGALSNGRTVIYGSAKEPEISDLANFLNTMGARVYGAGTGLIVVDGKRSLHGARYRPITDRIVAGTYIAAVAVSGGDIYIDGAVGDLMDAALYKFRYAGVNIYEDGQGIRAICNDRLKAIKQTVTLPYPGFPTDMQPILSAVLATAEGDSVITETLFENRFRYAYQLERMGAHIILDGNNTIMIHGSDLYGAEVYAQDLRGGAALTIAALAAEGATVINQVEHIDRGYESLDKELNFLGANISRLGTN